MLLTNKLKHDTALLSMGRIDISKFQELKILGFTTDDKLIFNKSCHTVTLNSPLLLAGSLLLDLHIKEAAALYEARKGSTRLVRGGSGGSA